MSLIYLLLMSFAMTEGIEVTDVNFLALPIFYVGDMICWELR